MLSKQLNNSTSEERQKRSFSEAFKRSKVKELESKRIKISEICHLYEVSRTSVYKWLKKYGKKTKENVKIVVEMESEAQRSKHLLERVAELERIVGMKQLEIDYLEQVLLVESQSVGYDIKKKHAQLSLSHLGSKNIAMTT